MSHVCSLFTQLPSSVPRHTHQEIGAVCTYGTDDREKGNLSICVVWNSTNGKELC